MSIDTNMSDRIITAFFDTRPAAENARKDVEALGIAPNQITLVAGQDSSSATTPHPDHDTGLWASLKDMFMPDEDRHSYVEGLRRGGFVLSVHADPTHYNRVLEVLDADGSVDMDHRETQWKSQGWQGYTSATPVTGVTSEAVGTTAALAATSAASTASTGAARSVLADGANETIELHQEQLRVGKRDVNHGRVRLRSYVVETPVQESINLRSENVQVERRPVNRPVTGEAVFQDRVIEAEEHEEVAVVSKEARVIEEISLSKTAADHTQQINETVRHTEVEVDDGRKGPGMASDATRFVASDAATTIMEHMDVLASDGAKVGTVDHLDTGERIKLAKNTSPDGQHHFIPLSWIDHVDQHVHLNKPIRDVRANWG